MEESKPDNHTSKDKKPARTVTLKMNRNLFFVLLAVVALIAVFFLGSAYGANKQKDKNTLPESAADRTAALSNRWTSVGTVTSASESEVKVKDSRGEEKTAAITKETKIIDRTGKSLSAKDVKKDQRIIVSGEKDGDKLTATRIRIQQ